MGFSLFCFLETGFLYNSPGTRLLEQAGLGTHRDSSASASPGLGLKVCTMDVNYQVKYMARA